MKYAICVVSALVVMGVLTGCAGQLPLTPTARAGDTIELGAGWKQKFDRKSLTVTITGSDSNVRAYLPNDPAVRAVINLYPDPLSYLVVGTRTNSNLGYGANYGLVINSGLTGNDPDWWETSIILDLPSDLPAGTATVAFQSANGEAYGPIPVEIIPGVGSPSPFSADTGNLQVSQMHAMEREPSFTVQFSGGSVLPAAIQLDLVHNPDASVGGTGTAFAVNPRGEAKNLVWSDNGTAMRVILSPARGSTTVSNWKGFKFYVTGGITGVQVQANSVKAYDANGNLITGVVVSVQ
jgi:hypothetical protein